MTIIKKYAMDAYRDWRYYLDKGYDTFVINITDDKQREYFEDMLNRHKHRYRREQKLFVL